MEISAIRYYRYSSRRTLAIIQLNIFHFTAGELEIIRNGDISESEKDGRLALLNTKCYCRTSFEWSVLLHFYAAWRKMIAKGEQSWAVETTMLEVRMLMIKRIYGIMQTLDI